MKKYFYTQYIFLNKSFLTYFVKIVTQVIKMFFVCTFTRVTVEFIWVKKNSIQYIL